METAGRGGKGLGRPKEGVRKNMELRVEAKSKGGGP